MSGGKLTVDGARVNTDATFLSGRSIEFAATFAATPFQIAGFGFDLNDQPWAIFGTQADGNLYARTHNGASVTNTPLPSSLLGSSHRYRIDWNAGSVEFFVDGALVATHVLELRLRHAPSGQRLQRRRSEHRRRLDADEPVRRVRQLRLAGVRRRDGIQLGSALVGRRHTCGHRCLAERADGQHADAGCEAGVHSAPISAPGQTIGGNSRYVQYRAQLTSSDPDATAVLREVEIGYAEGTDSEAPTIVERSPAPDATGVPSNTDVTVKFSEPMKPATIDGSDRAPAGPGRRQRRARDRQLCGRDGDARSERGTLGRHGLRGDRGRHRRGRGRQPAGWRRHVDIQHRGARTRDAHRHDRRRLRGRQTRRGDVCLGDGETERSS